MNQLVRYWYNPRQRIANNVGGWRLGTLTKTGRKFYHIIPCEPTDERRKYRIEWTKIVEVNYDGSAK